MPDDKKHDDVVKWSNQIEIEGAGPVLIVHGGQHPEGYKYAGNPPITLFFYTTPPIHIEMW